MYNVNKSLFLVLGLFILAIFTSSVVADPNYWGPAYDAQIHFPLPAGVKVSGAITNLKNNKDILYIEPNYKIYLLSTFPNDPYFSNLWGLHNTGQSFPTEGGSTDYGTLDADIDAPDAWDIYTGANNIIVAVLDTGIDYNHPDLAANMWVNQAKIWNRKLRNCGYVLSKCFFRRRAAGFSPFDKFGNINAAIGRFAVVNIALRLT